MAIPLALGVLLGSKSGDLLTRYERGGVCWLAQPLLLMPLIRLGGSTKLGDELDAGGKLR